MTAWPSPRRHVTTTILAGAGAVGDGLQLQQLVGRKQVVQERPEELSRLASVQILHVEELPVDVLDEEHVEFVDDQLRQHLHRLHLAQECRGQVLTPVDGLQKIISKPSVRDALMEGSVRKWANTPITIVRMQRFAMGGNTMPAVAAALRYGPRKGAADARGEGCEEEFNKGDHDRYPGGGGHHCRGV